MLFQTGSGKTHTMMGDIEELNCEVNPHRGMTPRIFEYLFNKIATVCPARPKSEVL